MTSTVTIVGNLTKDPELRFTQVGRATASLGIAVNRPRQNRQTQEWEEAPPVLFMSGYSQGVVGPSGLVDDGGTLLQNPFNAQTLLDQVQTVIARA
jgi:hypothetical protein